MYIRLSDTDRKQYDLHEEIWWENARFTNREARMVERAEPHGPGLSPRDWIDALIGEPVEENGVPVIDEKTGQAVRRPTAETLDIIIWLALHRAGTRVEWQDFEYDRNGLEIRPDVEDVEDAEGGDAEGKDEPSEPAETATTT